MHTDTAEVIIRNKNKKTALMTGKKHQTYRKATVNEKRREEKKKNTYRDFRQAQRNQENIHQSVSRHLSMLVATVAISYINPRKTFRALAFFKHFGN